MPANTSTNPPIDTPIGTSTSTSISTSISASISTPSSTPINTSRPAPARSRLSAPAHWDVFCRVVDNFGDIGVCWRLCADLAARGQRVRLWADDVSSLAWMAPGGADRVEVIDWQGDGPDLEPGRVVIEAFGCDPPPRFVDRIVAAAAHRAQAPRWINLEYLSAEPYVERSHRLPSPQPNGLHKTFWYPGFNPRTGGLLREPGLMLRRKAFERDPWLAARGLQRRPGERVVTLFCYDNPALPALIAGLAQTAALSSVLSSATESALTSAPASAPTPTLLLLTPGPAQRQVHALAAAAALPANIRVADLPWLSQTDFDAMLWSADLNLVRGEDSLVRAIWAGAPFLWQIYPQADGAHGPKLSAFIDTFIAASATSGTPEFATALRTAARRWNGLAGSGRVDTDNTNNTNDASDANNPIVLPPAAEWQAANRCWRESLLRQPDLVTQLLAFAAAKR